MMLRREEGLFFRGKGNPSRASSDRMAASRAVPVATEEATGIDSRDEGFPFPQQNDASHRKAGALFAARRILSLCRLFVSRVHVDGDAAENR